MTRRSFFAAISAAIAALFGRKPAGVEAFTFNIADAKRRAARLQRNVTIGTRLRVSSAEIVQLKGYRV